MNALDFKNAVFNSGLNVTCRLGTKHNHLLGKIVELTDNGKYVGDAKVVGIHQVPFYELNSYGNDSIYSNLLTIEHDPKCRTFNGLQEVMFETYGEFSVEEVVLLIVFDRDFRNN